MKHKLLKTILLILSSLFIFTPLFSQQKDSNQTVYINTEELIKIESLKPNSKNSLFEQYTSIVESNYKTISAGKEAEHIYFQYKNTEDFTVYQLASRCSINYDTLVTLNNLSSKDDVITNKTLILPVVQGLYIPLDKPTNSLETLLQENYKNQNITKNAYYYNINARNYIFLQSKRLSSTERAFFLDSTLQLPLEPDSFYVSSEFGKRKNPFSGQMKNHNGIDMAATEGTPVYAVKDGAVYATYENDTEFGNYIILSHDQGKTTSVYAHLSKICVEQYQNLKKGAIIGYVGKTGMATGSHLHFEIRQGGKPQNPREKLGL